MRGVKHGRVNKGGGVALVQQNCPKLHLGRKSDALACLRTLCGLSQVRIYFL